MDKYRLAKLVQWSGSGGVVGRKRLQKVVYFLQKAGCPFCADYTLHHYGPYSRDVAEGCDELVAAGFLAEQAEINGVGTQYTYRVSADAGTSAIAQTEGRSDIRTESFAAFRPLAEELLKKELWELELGSTILYFHEKLSNWDEAVRRACEFKKVDQERDTKVSGAKELAISIHARLLASGAES
jgi:uncharacterized protein YwgA